MPLSEYEQRVLEELERDLGADPKLGHAMSRGPRARHRLTFAALGVVVGLGIVLGGAIAQMPVLGIAGFALMILAALWGLLSPRPGPTKSTGNSGPSPQSPKTQGAKPKQDEGFMRRVEERFDRRREQGDV